MSKQRQLVFEDERKDLEQRLATIDQERFPLALLLDQITDPKNVGSIFRLADAARVAHIYLYKCEVKIKNKQLVRASRSTTKYVPFTIIDDAQVVKDLGYELVSLEVTESSIPYASFQPAKKTLLIIGNENYGVSQEWLNSSSTSIHIPMHGINTSMNVASATAIAMYDLIAKLS